MKDARVGLAQEPSPDEELMAVFLACMGRRTSLGGSPEAAQSVATIELVSFVRL